MSVMPSSTVVGVFGDRSMAEQAIEALHNAGFEHEQIRYSVPGTSGGFLGDLKSLFTGTGAGGNDLANNLTSVGLSDEEVRYYSNEYNKGNVILAVRAPEQEQEALRIMHQYGAFNVGVKPEDTAHSAQQPSDYAQESNYMSPEQQGSSMSPEQQSNMQKWDTQPQPQVAGARPSSVSQQDVVTPERGQAYPSPETQQPQANVVNPEQEAQYQRPPTSGVAPGQETAYQRPSTYETPPGQGTASQAPSTSKGDREQDAKAQASSAGGVVTPEHQDEYQQMQEELQAAKLQLQEAKAQLQAAKERDTHSKMTREREQQLKATRQQLDETRSALQATLAELRETQTRAEQ